VRLAAGVEYDGSVFFGWQRQRQSPTVQACIEQALGQVADHAVVVHCAGRTDTGVHALAQVVHFDTPARRSERSWVLGANCQLPPGVVLRWVRPVPGEFHARYSAARRSYCYRILNRSVPSALDRARVAWIRRPLDADRMHQAAQVLVGEHDFSSFRASGCQARSPVRRIHSIAVGRRGSEVRINVQANAFVYHMVRNIVGVLIAVGEGRQDEHWVEEVLEARDRTRGGITAPAEGLYFLGPLYPEFPELPLVGCADFAPLLSEMQ